MALFFLKFTYRFPATEENTNPRICQLFFKREPWGEYVETTPDDEKAEPAFFSESLNRFLVYVDGKLAFDSTPLNSTDTLFSESLTSDPEWEIGQLDDGGSVTQFTINLSAAYAESSVTIVIQQKKPQVPWIRWDRVTFGGDLDHRGLVRTKVLPASALRVQQLIDQPQPNRQYFIPFTIIAQPSASIGEGFGTWNIYNNTSGALSSATLTDLTLYTRLDFKMRFISLSLDLSPVPVPVFLAETFRATDRTAPAFGVMTASGIQTIESQRITYNYYDELDDVIDKVKDNFSPYADTFQESETDQSVPIRDVDHDGTATIVDRILELSQTPSTRLSSVRSPSFFDEIDEDDEVALQIFRKNGERELLYLLEKYSVIGKSVVIKDIEGISSDKSLSDSFGVDIYDMGKPNTFLIVEYADSEEFAGEAPIQFEASKKYTIFCKVICPEWDVRFEYYGWRDVDDIWGVKRSTVRFIKSKVAEGSVGNLSEIEDPFVFLVVRTRYGEPITNLGDQDVHIFKNEDHNDGILEQKEEEEEETGEEGEEEETEEEEEIDLSDRTLINVPLDDHSLNPVGVILTDLYRETTPGYGLQVRGSHGMFYKSGDPNVNFGAIANQIFGDLNSPHIRFNPYNVGDLLDGRGSSLQNGATVEILSNMGFDKTVDDSTVPFSTGEIIRGSDSTRSLLGGNLSYIASTVTETAPEFPVPAIISFKSNLKARQEYLTFSDLEGGKIHNFGIHKWNEVSFEPVEEFVLSNPEFINPKEDVSVNNQSIQHVVQLDQFENVLADIEAENGVIKITNFEMDNLSEILVDVSEISGSERHNKRHVYPFVVFYLNLDNQEETEPREEEDQAAADDRVFVPFGYMDHKGNIIPRVYYLRKGENHLNVGDIESPTEIRIVPAIGLDGEDEEETSEGENGSSTSVTISKDKTTLYQPKDILNKRPIGHIRLETGEQLFLFEAKHPTIGTPDMVLATILDPLRAKAYYPLLRDQEEHEIEPNYRLEKYIVDDLLNFVSVENSQRNRYYLMGYMRDPQLVQTVDNYFHLIGWLYDQESGEESGHLASLPIPVNVVSSGQSVFEVAKLSSANLNLKSDLDTEDPDGGKFPFFHREGMENYIIADDVPYQKVGACTIERVKTDLVFATMPDTSRVRAWFDAGAGFRWTELSPDFMDTIFHVGDKTNSVIKPYRVSCVKDPRGANVLMFCLCRIDSQSYSIVYKTVPYSSLMYALEQTSAEEDIDEDHAEMKVLRAQRVFLAVGNPKTWVDDDDTDIYIGNCEKKDGQYIGLGDLGDDYSVPIEGTQSVERNLNNLQEIAATWDDRNAILKVYYINNSGLRDCRISNSFGNTWHDLAHF